MREHLVKVGMAVIAILGLALFTPSVAGAEGGKTSLVPLSCSSEAAAALVTPAAPEKLEGASEKQLPQELQNLFSPKQATCYNFRCQTNAECTEICHDVAKCCAEPSCYSGGPSSGHFGYCVMM